MKRSLPLREAYRFASSRKLGAQAQRIRERRVKAKGKKYTSSIRRGWVMVLFQSTGVFEEFWREYWPYYQTPSGQTTSRRYLRLVLQDSKI